MMMSSGTIKNYFLTAIRNLWKNKTTAIIKITGLAIGLSAVQLIFLFVRFEYSFDNYDKKGDRIYRVAYHVSEPNIGKYSTARTGRNLKSLLLTNFPEIESVSQVAWMGNIFISQHNHQYKESKFLFGDPSVLTMFSFPMKEGDRYTALNDPKSVVISSKIAKKYFGNKNPIGKYLDDKLHLKVTGIVDVPDNSHFRFDILASYATLYDFFPFIKNTENENIGRNVYTYILLKKNTNVSELENKLPKFTKTYIDNGAYSSVGLFLEPLKKIYLESQSDAYLGELTTTKFTKFIIYLFEFLGLIIVVIASVNFINIAVAEITGRAKEVGVRKIYGSKKAGIFFQFVFEYWLYALIAIIFSIIIVQISLPFINSLINRQIQVNYYEYFIAASILLLVITALAGAYPSLTMAGVSPVRAFQLGFKGPKGHIVQSALVVFQVCVSIILIITTLFITKQIKQFTKVDTAINTKNELVIRMPRSKITQNYELLKSEFSKIPNIISVSASSNIPAVSGAHMLTIEIDDGKEIPFRYISVDAGFIKNLGIKTIQGRSFTPGSMSDIKSSFLLNKSAVKELGINNPVGRNVTLMANDIGRPSVIATGKIIGVIDDYPYRPTYDASRGVIFNNDPDRYTAMFVRISPEEQKKTVMMIKDKLKNLFPDAAMSVNFLNDEIKNDPFILKLYSIQRFISAAAIFSFFIALLGLLGLSIFAARQRTKEIGIRRVNGASILKLLILVNKKLMILVLCSIVLSFPVVYFIITAIKRESPRSADISITTYGVVFLLIMALTMLAISWQSLRTAKENPVEALRYE